MNKSKKNTLPRYKVETVAVSTFTRRIRQVEKTCPVCGKTFWGRTNQTYCDDPPLVCKNKAAYERNAEKRRAERREKYRQQKATPKT